MVKKDGKKTFRFVPFQRKEVVNDPTPLYEDGLPGIHELKAFNPQFRWPTRPHPSYGNAFIQRPGLIMCLLPIVERFPAFYYSASWSKSYQADPPPELSANRYLPKLLFVKHSQFPPQDWRPFLLQRPNVCSLWASDSFINPQGMAVATRVAF